jgi:peptidoglycan/LPS O-acetylase OafA/YrhL
VPKLLSVQILRGLAALSVAMLHAQHDAGSLMAAGGRAWEPGIRLPWAAGVDVFFVISGFIMVHASHGLFGREGARAIFLARRAARIVPLYWSVTTLYLALALMAPGLLNSEILEPWPILASYLFIPFERPDGVAQPLYSLGWTLNYEMFFYVLFAVAVAWSYRRAVLTLAVALLALVAVGAAFRLPQPFAFWTSPIILEFAFGLALGHLRVRGVALAGPAQAMLAVMGLALLALDLTQPTGVLPAPRALAWGVPAALLVAAAALGRRQPSPASAATRLGVALGDASYALYLLHPFAIRGIRALVGATGFGPALGPAGFIVLSLAGAILVALAAHRSFERPATAWMRLRLGSLRAAWA